MKKAPPYLIVSLDFPEVEQCLTFVKKLDPQKCRLKIGSILFTQAGPGLIEQLHRLGFSVFLDLKYHDIPNTVYGCVKAACELGVWMCNVHVSGGAAMLAAAREALASFNTPPLLIGVTVLTSINQAMLHELHPQLQLEQYVLSLAKLAAAKQLDGVVCSAQEAPLLRQQLGDDLVLVTPGIRLEKTSRGDQQRVMTPREALAAGSDYLVVGRSITQAAEPQAAVNQIVEQCDAASVDTKQ